MQKNQAKRAFSILKHLAENIFSIFRQAAVNVSLCVGFTLSSTAVSTIFSDSKGAKKIFYFFIKIT